MRLVSQQDGRLLLLVVIVIAIAGAVVSCGGGNDADSPTATSQSSATAVPNGTSPPASSGTSTATSAPTATENPNAPAEQSGSVVIAVSEIGNSPSGLPRDCPVCEFITNASVQDTLLLSVLDDEGTLIEAPGLAESWTLADDGSYTDFKLRKGVQFHDGFGELTAEDVAWTFNEAAAEDSVHATKSEIITALAADSSVEAIDEYTVRMHWTAFGVPTYPKTVTGYREGVGIFSKKAFDEKGADWMRENVTGTGPFEMVEWTAGDRLVIQAVPNHWRVTPTIEQATYVQIPESTVRRGMLESGQAQIADLALSDWPATVANGKYAKAPEGALIDQALIMGGNYWEKTHPVSGEPLQRDLHADTLAWVGDPDDAQSMDRALKVRQALAMSIDREGINDALFAGEGRPSYIGGENDADPIVARSVEPIPYDLETARQLLTEAGLDGGFPLEIYASEAGSLGDEMARILAADWNGELNIDVTIDNTPYSTYRPNFINRTTQALSWRAGGAFAPSTWQEEWYASAIVSNEDGSAGGGFNSGLEIPKASETLLTKQSATDLQPVIDATEEYIRYMHEQRLWPGAIEYQAAAIYDPSAICGWDQWPMATGGLGGARNLETVRLCK